MDRPLHIAVAILLALHASAAPADLYSVTNTDDAGVGSLRQAILDVNAHAGPDGILFEIPGSGLHVLTPASELPPLTGPTVVTGLSEEDASCGVWPPTLRVVIDGFQAGAGASGLTLFGDDSVVTGIVIRNFDAHGIAVQNADRVTLRCNFIGTSADGSLALGNGGDGILLNSSVDSAVGGTSASHRNLISGNGAAGVEIGLNSPGTEVIGNYVGTDAAGMAALPNEVGVRSTSPDVTIGGVAPDGGNLISGNTTGILIFHEGTTGNLVFGNRIGLDAEGEPTLGNGTGVAVNAGATDTLIGSTLEGLGNEIAGNDGNGVLLFNDETTLGNAIRGNSIHDNGGLGIALAGSGSDPTPNDPGDADEGPNRLQNFPEIASAFQDGEAPIDVAYFVPTDPANASYPITVDVYLADADGEEGLIWLASDQFQEADHAAGVPKHLAIALLFGDPGPHELVATATDADGNGSEFGAAATVPEPGAAPVAAGLALGALALGRARRR